MQGCLKYTNLVGAGTGSTQGHHLRLRQYKLSSLSCRNQTLGHSWQRSLLTPSPLRIKHSQDVRTSYDKSAEVEVFVKTYRTAGSDNGKTDLSLWVDTAQIFRRN